MRTVASAPIASASAASHSECATGGPTVTENPIGEVRQGVLVTPSTASSATLVRFQNRVPFGRQVVRSQLSSSDVVGHTAPSVPRTNSRSPAGTSTR